MSPRRMFRGKTGWWTSAGAMVVVAGVLAGTMLANAAGPPLPARTPAQLLAAMRNAKAPSAFTAVITENANLGFPSIPDIAGLQSPALSAASLISGTHTVDIWYAGPRHVRIALPVSFGETDLRVNGNQVWLWNSHSQTATHYILPAGPTPAQIKLPAGRLRFLPRPLLPRCLAALRTGRLAGSPKQLKVRIIKCLNSAKIARGFSAAFKPLTPIQAADKFLAAVGPTTKVSVAGSTVVAGRSVYQLVIAPRTNQSLISQIVIAVDSKTYLPLQLRVFARGMSSPAFQIGFTSLTFGQPAASNFTFTPPPGAHVKTEKLPQVMPGLLGPLASAPLASASLGIPPLGTPFLPASTPAIRIAVPSKQLVKIAGPVKLRALRAKITKLLKKLGRGKGVQVSWISTSMSAVRVANPYAIPPGGSPGAALPGVKVLGSGWLCVAVIPVAPRFTAAPARGGLSAPSPAKAVGSRQVVISGGSPQAPVILALLRVLLNSAARVHGSWGSGRLLRTSLLSVLITSNGKVLIGAVTPAVLYADAAKVK